jgi:hypothetical protein
MHVMLPNGLLPKIGTTGGVRQGRSLSPTLLLLFLFDLPEFLSSHTDECWFGMAIRHVFSIIPPCMDLQ